MVPHCRNGTIRVNYLNARSVCNKTITIRDQIIDNSVDILCLGETWLSEDDGPLFPSFCQILIIFFIIRGVTDEEAE